MKNYDACFLGQLKGRCPLDEVIWQNFTTPSPPPLSLRLTIVSFPRLFVGSDLLGWIKTMLSQISFISLKSQDETKLFLHIVSHMKLEKPFSFRNGKHVPCFQVNLLAFYHKRLSRIGYPTNYLLCWKQWEAQQCALVNTKGRPLLGVFEVSLKRILDKVSSDKKIYTKTIRLFAIAFYP